MKQRDLQPELMDDPDIDQDMHRHALVGLARLNTFSGVRSAMYRRIRSIAMEKPSGSVRLLDVASGSGDLPIAWAASAKRDNISLEITTVDISPTAVESQMAGAEKAGLKISAIALDCLQDELPSGFDIATCSLFTHHLENDQVSTLLRSMRRASNDAILVCDLERSRLNLGLVSFASHTLSRSPVVHTDSKISVRAAFTRAEFKAIAEDALSQSVSMQSLFPCRFVMTARAFSSRAFSSRGST